MESKRLVGTALVILAGIGGRLAVRSMFSPDVKSEKFLSKISDEMNATLPKLVDSETELTTTAAAPGVFTYKYRLVNHSSADLDVSAMTAAIEPSIRSGACSDKDTRKVLDEGVTLRYSYSDKDNVHLTDVDVTQASCN